MNFFVAYSIAVITVATMSTANRVKKALEGATELSVRYSLLIRVPKDEAYYTNATVQGSIAVSQHTVVEYTEEVGLIVTATELLEGVHADEKTNFPNLESEHIVKIQSIECIEVEYNNSGTPSQNLFKVTKSYAKDVYLVDVSNIGGAVVFNTYDFVATHLGWNTLPGKAEIVRYDGKRYAQIYLPEAAKYTIKLVSQIKGADKFPTTLLNEKSTGVIVIWMADDEGKV